MRALTPRQNLGALPVYRWHLEGGTCVALSPDIPWTHLEERVILAMLRTASAKRKLHQEVSLGLRDRVLSRACRSRLWFPFHHPDDLAPTA